MVHAMLAFLMATGAATHFYAITSPECEPWGVEPNSLPWPLPPGAVQGLILPADANEPARWLFPVGPYERVGSWCDPEGDEISVRVVSSTVPGATVEVLGDRWRLAGTLAEGPNVFIVEATDYREEGDEASSLWTIPVWGRTPNRPPVLRPH